MNTAPGHLKGEPLEFFNSVVDDYSLEPHHLKLLVLACDCLTRIIDARATIDKAGATYIDKSGQPKMHPAVKVEIDNKILFSRLLREMQLSAEVPDDSRPPRLEVK